MSDRSRGVADSASRQILLVEDEAIIALAEAQRLRQRGYLVTTAHTGDAAVERGTRSDIDLILMDIDLGGDGIDGTEAAQRILRRREVPIVFLTGHAEEEMVEKVRGITRYGYVLKDSGEFVLFQAIEMAFELFQAKRNAQQLTTAHDEHYLKTELYDLVQTDRAVFDFLQAGSLDGIWYWDLEHQENEWMSPRFWELFGYDPATKQHSPAEWQDLIHPDDLQVALDNFTKHLADPHHPYDQVVRYTHADGSTVWVRCRGIAIRDSSGTPIRMLGAHNDLTDLKRTETRLQESLAENSREVAEKRLLLQELNHRVKNNLMMVASLVKLEDARLGDRADLSDVLARINAIMTIHQQMQESAAYDSVDVGPYLETVVASALASEPSAQVVMNFQPLRLSTGTAVTLGLIVNEIATNAAKHGFNNVEPPVFTIESRRTNSHCEIIVSNSGNPFPEDSEIARADSLGLQLITELANQIGAEVLLERTPQAKYTIRVPMDRER